ncbi:MAG: PEP-CTERM sorting domain-containing protein [Akkermansiaceae bacterium]|nr:PEP-CTERM sorting domain-containing protein [Akkermansiaceae bacterium]
MDGTWWVSNAAITRTTNTPWIRVSLSLLEADLHKVGNEMGQLGTDTYEQTFADIRAIRIMSSNVGTAAIGDEFFGPVGIDNVSLMAVPEPSSALLFGAAFGLALTRRWR